MNNGSPVELILLEYQCRDFNDRTIILRIKNSPFGTSNIQQVAWGVSPNFPVLTPPVFAIYQEVTGFTPKGNDRVMALPFGGQLVDCKHSFDDAMKRAYELAQEDALSLAQKCRAEHPSLEIKLFDRTSYAEKQLPPTNDPDHQLWFQPTWFYEI